ncbi:hypothetical protein FRB90_007748 [Tulasnella sp. 427]|nr:hypothetical protein FRB90_007748 [Tulasnella sp. 427]
MDPTLLRMKMMEAPERTLHQTMSAIDKRLGCTAQPIEGQQRSYRLGKEQMWRTAVEREKIGTEEEKETGVQE